MHAFGKNIELNIDVQSNEILLLGPVDEAAGKMLQGSLILDLAEPIKVKSVTLSFIGEMKVCWSEGIGHHQNNYKQERTLLSHIWEFVKPQALILQPNTRSKTPPKKNILLSAGRHKWDFELMIPGDLPQTLESEMGCICYQLKATIERSTFIQNTVKKRSIRILRCILPSEFELVQSLEIHSTWAQKMVYDISAPSKLFSFNDIIPISFQILPIASGLRIHAIIGSIKEYCTYTANGHKKTENRIVRLVRMDNPFPETVASIESPSLPITWNTVLEIPVPSKSPIIFADADSEMISIRHRLKFVMSLINADGHISELRCAVPVTIIESFAITEELTILPAYDEMWRSVPYHSHVVETLRSRTSISAYGTNEPSIDSPPSVLHNASEPVTIHGWSHFLSTSSFTTPVINKINEEDNAYLSDLTNRSQPMAIPESNSSSRHHSRHPSMEELEEDMGVSTNNSSLSEEPILWNGINLWKVPSYRSLSTMDQNIFPASLPPAYDSLIN